MLQYEMETVNMTANKIGCRSRHGYIANISIERLDSESDGWQAIAPSDRNMIVQQHYTTLTSPLASHPEDVGSLD